MDFRQTKMQELALLLREVNACSHLVGRKPRVAWHFRCSRWRVRSPSIGRIALPVNDVLNRVAKRQGRVCATRAPSILPRSKRGVEPRHILDVPVIWTKWNIFHKSRPRLMVHKVCTNRHLRRSASTVNGTEMCQNQEKRGSWHNPQIVGAVNQRVSEAHAGATFHHRKVDRAF